MEGKLRLERRPPARPVDRISLHAGSESGAPAIASVHPDGQVSGHPMSSPPKTKREHLRQLVEEKNHWNRPLTEAERAQGFLGWHERGYLPHCDYPGLLQLVTFRLADSLPASRRGEWEHLLKIENLRERRTDTSTEASANAICAILGSQSSAKKRYSSSIMNATSFRLGAWFRMTFMSS